MADEIFLVQKDGGLVEMHRRPPVKEADLQELLARHPNLIPGAQIDSSSPRRWLLISQEVGIPSGEDTGNRWAIDHVFIDQDGVPSLVEVKRSSDTRIRREVVGQMLDYAANAVVYWPVEEMRKRFDRDCERRKIIPEEELGRFLNDEMDPEEFWSVVDTNLRAGKVRLVFVADEIPPELQRIVEFLNKQMCPADVLAVEVGYYAGGDLRTLVPRVVGYTAEAQDKKAATKTERRIWDETSYFEDLAARTSPQAIDTARTLHEWAKTNATTIRFGTGATKGGLGAVVGSLELNKRVFTMYSDGRLELCFYSLMGLPPFDQDAKRLEWSKKLNELPPFNISEEQIAKFPTIGLEELADAELLKIFLSTLDWVVDEVRTASEN